MLADGGHELRPIERFRLLLLLREAETRVGIGGAGRERTDGTSRIASGCRTSGFVAFPCTTAQSQDKEEQDNDGRDDADENFLEVHRKRKQSIIYYSIVN